MAKKSKTKSKKVFASQAIRNTGDKKNKSLFPFILMLIVLTSLCLWPMLKNDFTNWDDEFYVVSNALLRGPDWVGIFTQPVVSNYHPITVISLAINYAISGTEPWSYLFFNLLLHLVNTSLVFYFIYSISGKKVWVAFLTAFIFAIHPMHVESVAWISERKDVLYTFFFLLSLMAYWNYLLSHKTTHYLFCFFLFAFSLLSKPAAIILPVVLFLLDYWKGRKYSHKLILEKIPFFVLSILIAVITFKFQSTTAMASLDMYSLVARLLFACYVVMIYILRFFIPHPLSAFHPFPPPDDLGWPVYLAPVFIGGLLFFIWRFRQKKLIVFGLGFFLINLLLVLQIVSIGYTIVSERYTYIPYIGIAFILAMLIEKYFIAKNKLAWAIATLIFVVLGYLSFKRTQVWKDSDSLWTDVIKHYPQTAMPRGERAQFNYNKAIMMEPGETATALYQRVIEDCSMAINLVRASSKASKQKEGTSMYYMRGTSYNGINKYEKAFDDFNHCIHLDSNYSEAFYYRGTLLVNHYNKNAEALKDFNKAIQLNPQGKYYLNRSICYFKLGDMANAKADGIMATQKGIVLPDNYKKLLNL